MKMAYKKYSLQGKLGIRGEAFFESLIAGHAIPHHVTGSKDLGIDYFCEWVDDDKPTGILFAIQVKTSSQLKPIFVQIDTSMSNGLETYSISNSKLNTKEATLNYWRGLNIPTYLFVIGIDRTQADKMDCYYKRYTAMLTKNEPPDKHFYKVSKGNTFIGFVDPRHKQGGFARDLYIDYMRCDYSRGFVAFLDPELMGLNQFGPQIIFADLVKEYRANISKYYEQIIPMMNKILSETSW